MEWLGYLLKVSACLALFYAFYHFCLQRLTFFNLNRFYLLSTLMLSFVIPVMQLQVQRAARQQAQTAGEEVFVWTSTSTDLQNTVSVEPLSAVSPNAVVINWEEVLFAGYWFIAVLLFGMFAFQVLQLLKYARRVNRRIGRIKVVFKPQGFTNCSFLNYVFVNQQALSEEEMAVILRHEQVHVSRYHSVDKLFLSACKALLWFNPVIYLYDKALTQVHEYEADKETSATIGNTSYAGILLAIAVRNNNPSLAHSFVQNPLRGRINMLFSNQSKNMKKLMYLAALPLGLALTWAFAVQVVYASLPVPMPKDAPVRPVQTEEVPLKTLPLKKSEVKKPALRTAPSDTLWMIRIPGLNSHSEVFIDGKSYDKDILTKISPSCLKSFSTSGSKIELSTRNNKIEYATKIDRENAIARDKARASGKLYFRYTQKHQDGSKYDYIEIDVKGNGGGGVSLEKGKKLLLIYEGKQYSEREFKKLTADQFMNRGMSFSNGAETNEEIKSKYGKGYGSMIEIFMPTISSEKKTFRDPGNADANSKLSYSAKDSIVVDKDKKYLILFGGINITQGKLSINADKAKYETPGQIVYAKDVSFTSDRYHNPVTAAFMKFDLKEGTYQILNSMPDL